MSQKDKHFNRKEKVLGQFFTPDVVAQFIVEYSIKVLGERETNLACDPACGDGVFLKFLIEHNFDVLGVDIDPTIKDMTPENISNHIVISNGLLDIPNEGNYDIVVGNPPFSSKYGRITDKNILSRFELGKNKRSQAIEILFLEKFFKCVRDGGIIGIILPFGIFSNTNLKYVREFILRNSQIISVVSLPRNTFKNTTARTVILFVRKGKPHSGKILMVSLKSIDDLVNKNIEELGKFVEIEDTILYPEYYLEDRLELKNSEPLGKLVDIRSGRTEYGENRKFSKTGIPFISAKVVTPLGIDFTRDEKFVNPQSKMFKRKAYIRKGEIVFVRVGNGTIGRVSVVTSRDEEGVVDDWSYILTVKSKKVNPYYLALYLQTDIIRKEILRLARGVGTTTIPQKQLMRIPVVIPTKELLNECESVYKEIVSLRKNGHIESANKKLNEIKEKIEQLIKENMLNTSKEI